MERRGKRKKKSIGMVKSPKKHSALRIAAFGTLAAIGSYFATSKLYSAALNHTLNKYSEAAALYNTYVDTIEEDYARSMCAEETLQLGRFCDNYLDDAVTRLIVRGVDAKRLIVRGTDRGIDKDIERLCKDSRRHNRDVYQRDIRRFIAQIENDPELRQRIEEEIYASPDEISFRVEKKGEKIGEPGEGGWEGGYVLKFSDDPSDVVVRKYIEQLKADPQVQERLADIANGKEWSEQQLVERIYILLDSYSSRNSLERDVIDELKRDFSGEGGLRYSIETMAANHRESLQQLKAQKEGFRESMAQLQTSNRFYSLAESNRHTITIDLVGYDKRLMEHRELLLEKERLVVKKGMIILEWTEKLRRNARELPDRLWEEVDERTASHKMFGLDQSDAFNPLLIAYGHTHHHNSKPEKYKHDLSPLDLGNTLRKPEIVFAALPDRWQIYVGICGKSELAAEYARTDISR